MNKKIRQAFTLIELLVAIAIIGILSALIFVQTNNTINASKDSKRKADIQLIANAIVSYSAEQYSQKPITDFDGCTINGDCPASIVSDLEPFLATLPSDPDSGNYYVYKSLTGEDCTISAALSNGETYQYNCLDESMSQSAPVNGSCGSRANAISAGYPSLQSDWNLDTTYCFSTTPSATPSFPSSPGTFVEWVCPGEYLGTSVTCYAYHALDGVCNTAMSNTESTPYADSASSWPAANYCSSGTEDSSPQFPQDGTYVSWKCNGKYGGNSPSCYAYHADDGVCGSLANTTSTAYPQGSGTDNWASSDFCSSGLQSSTPAYPQEGNYSSWSCSGVYSSTSASCAAYRGQSGTCGASNGGSYYLSSEITSPCSSGSTLSVSPSGNSFVWSCNPIYVGSTASCTASLKKNGVCGNSGPYTSLSSGTCLVGTASGLSGSGPWSWQCFGINGGNSAQCSASICTISSRSISWYTKTCGSNWSGMAGYCGCGTFGTSGCNSGEVMSNTVCSNSHDSGPTCVSDTSSCSATCTSACPGSTLNVRTISWYTKTCGANWTGMAGYCGCGTFGTTSCNPGETMVGVTSTNTYDSGPTCVSSTTNYSASCVSNVSQ